jgi:hypothetical protein
MTIKHVEDVSELAEAHRVETRRVPWKKLSALGEEVEAWLHDPVNAAKGSYATGIKLTGELRGDRCFVLYFDDVDTAFNCKLRWS